MLTKQSTLIEESSWFDTVSDVPSVEKSPIPKNSNETSIESESIADTEELDSMDSEPKKKIVN